MKRFLAILVMLCITIVFALVTVKPVEGASKQIISVIEEGNIDFSNSYIIIKDNETGVEYIVIDGVESVSITPRLEGDYMP